MKLGLERERFGDIIVFDKEAYVIVLTENAEYICHNLKLFSKFKKSKIQIIELSDIKTKEICFEEVNLVVASERLDNFVAEIVKCSRSKAEEWILSERVLVNHVIETKQSKTIKLKDILTIRGKGKFIVDELIGTNKSGRKKYLLKKYS